MEFSFAEYISELTRFELLEVYYLSRNALLNDVTIFMTLLFAYVTVAYIVSKKLTTFQAIAICVLYSSFTLYLASSAYNSLVGLSQIGLAISGMDSSRDSLILATFLLVAWIFSIILFIQSRRRGHSHELGCSRRDR